jgi:hypothetical protein
VHKFIQYAKQVPGAAAITRELKKVLLKRILIPEPEINYPELRPGDVENARLFANRSSMIEAFRPLLQGKIIAELGVGYGDFSEVLIKILAPEQFFAFDTFEWHHVPVVWGKPTNEVFGNLTHRECYEKKFSRTSARVVTEEGDSAANLRKYPDRFFDMIYIDADHSYPGVKKDADISKGKIKDDGILIFNDYIMFDHCGVAEPNYGVWYGVVQAVNQLVVHENFEVIGFAFAKDMFCDIAVRRKSDRLKMESCLPSG